MPPGAAPQGPPVQPPGDDQQLQAADEDVVQAHALAGGFNVVCIDEHNEEETFENHGDRVDQQLCRFVPQHCRGTDEQRKDE